MFSIYDTRYNKPILFQHSSQSKTTLDARAEHLNRFIQITAGNYSKPFVVKSVIK
jgi:hypothetical protein